MKLAFWNMNTGVGSFVDKQKAVSTWCAETQPELLILEEVSSTLAADAGGAGLTKMTGMTLLGFVNTLDKNLDASTKCIAALAGPKTKIKFAATALGFPGLDQKRNLVKVTTSNLTSNLYIWGIHANASISGGINARTAAETYLASAVGAGAIVGGDYNASFSKPADARVLATVSTRFDGKPLTATQWNNEGGSAMNGAAMQKELNLSRVVYANTKLNGVIDYALSGPGVKIAGLPNAGSQANWTDIVALFDHCPVVFDVAVQVK